MKYSKILGTGSYLPREVVTNKDLEKRIETTDEWIVERTGIRERRKASEDETTSKMAAWSAERALEAAQVDKNDIDMLIVATCSPDKIMPSAACMVQEHLGIGGCTAFDVVAVCSGFIYGLSIANQFIRSGTIKNALVIGSETMTRVIDQTDRGTCILFGDGAGAVVLGASDEPGIHKVQLHADGNYGHLLYANGHNGVSHEETPFAVMQGREVFKFAVNRMGEMFDAVLEDTDISRESIDWLVPHQANIRIMQAMAKKLSLPMTSVVQTVAEHGNTSAASIPLALDHAVRTGQVKRGQNLLFDAFGSGLTWGAAVLTY